MATTAILITLLCDGTPVATTSPSSSDGRVTIIPIGGGSSVYFSVTWPDDYNYQTSVQVTGNITSSGPTYNYSITVNQGLYPPTFAYAELNVC